MVGRRFTGRQLSVKSRLGNPRTNANFDARTILNRRKVQSRGAIRKVAPSLITKRTGVAGRLGLISPSRRKRVGVKNFPNFTIVTPSAAIKTLPKSPKAKKSAARITVTRGSVSKTIVNEGGARRLKLRKTAGQLSPGSLVYPGDRIGIERQVAVVKGMPVTGMRAMEMEMSRRTVGRSASSTFLSRGMPASSSISAPATTFISAIDRVSREKPGSVEVRYADEADDEASLDAVPMEIEAPHVSSTKTPITVRLSQPKSKKVDLPKPLKGHKIILSNLKDTVSDNDVKELCSSIGSSLLDAKLIRPGYGIAVYKDLEDAENVIEQYNERELDGQAMILKLVPSGGESQETATISQHPARKSRMQITPSPTSDQEDDEDEEIAQADPVTKMKLDKLLANQRKAGGDRGPEPDRSLITSAMFQSKNKIQSGVTFTVKI